MKQTVLDRYERTADGSIIIDVTATRVEDLYNDFDKSAPYARRDLDQDLVHYLIGCANELKREAFVMRFTLDHPPDDGNQARIRKSVSDYFFYLIENEQQQIGQKIRQSTILFGVGLVILFVSVSFNQSMVAARSLFSTVLAEGITIVAWVSLWEALATFSIEWFPHRKKIALYRRLADAEVSFRGRSGEKQD